MAVAVITMVAVPAIRILEAVAGDQVIIYPRCQAAPILRLHQVARAGLQLNRRHRTTVTAVTAATTPTEIIQPAKQLAADGREAR